MSDIKFLIHYQISTVVLLMFGIGLMFSSHTSSWRNDFCMPGLKLNHISKRCLRPVNHDDVIKWKHFPRYSPFVRGIHRSPVNSPYRGQWRRSLMFSLICAWINGWVNNREAGDLRRHRSHYDVTVMQGWTKSVSSLQYQECNISRATTSQMNASRFKYENSLFTYCSLYRYKTVSRPSYLYNGIFLYCTDSIFIVRRYRDIKYQRCVIIPCSNWGQSGVFPWSYNEWNLNHFTFSPMEWTETGKKNNRSSGSNLS